MNAWTLLILISLVGCRAKVEPATSPEQKQDQDNRGIRVIRMTNQAYPPTPDSQEIPMVDVPDQYRTYTLLAEVPFTEKDVKGIKNQARLLGGEAVIIPNGLEGMNYKIIRYGPPDRFLRYEDGDWSGLKKR